ncbi:LptA/OstA family protein [bacterium]|nr:LptA/OstA family protein [bacterium]
MKRKTKYIRKSTVIFLFITVFVFSVILFNSAISAQDKNQDSTAKEKSHLDASEEDEVIEGVADSFEQDEKKGIIVFTGNVKITRENGYLNADKVTVYRDVETDDVIKTIAEGNVDMKDGDLLATCEHAVLNESDDTIELTDSVVVKQKEDVIEAPYITYNRQTGIRKGKGNDTDSVQFRVRLNKKKTAETESSEATSEDEIEKKE